MELQEIHKIKEIAPNLMIADYIEGIGDRERVAQIVNELTEVKLLTTELTEVKSVVQNEFYKNKKSFEELAASRNRCIPLICCNLIFAIGMTNLELLHWQKKVRITPLDLS